MPVVILQWPEFFWLLWTFKILLSEHKDQHMVYENQLLVDMQ